jgi:hypothetical protein
MRPLPFTNFIASSKQDNSPVMLMKIKLLLPLSVLWWTTMTNLQVSELVHEV